MRYALVLSMGLVAWASPSLATGIFWADCNSGIADRQLRGCSFVIKRGGPDLAVAYNNRAHAYHLKGEYDRAIADLQQAIKLRPNYALAHNNLGLAYNRKGSFDLAVSSFDSAVRLRPAFALAYGNRCDALNRKGEHERAIADCDQAIHLRPDLAYAYRLPGSAYRGRGDYARALENLARAIRLEPGHSASHVERALTYEAMGNSTAAIAEFGASLALPETDPVDREAKDVARQHIAALQSKQPLLQANNSASGVPALAPAPQAAQEKTTEPSPPPVAQAQIQGRRVALVIGNSAYRSVARLDNPVNDAKLMAESLKSLGFKLVGGGALLDLDKGGFDTAVQNFGKEMQGADVGLFYYAGHGLGLGGTNYLVPVSANPTREADVDFQMMDVEVVLHQMKASGTKLNVVMLDACRNNPFGGSGFRSGSGGLTQMQAPEGTLIAYATQPGNVAQDGAGRHSPYSKVLAETIRKPGLDIFQAFNQVGLAVKKATGGAQQPWVSNSPIEGEFYFAGR